jgi:cobyrinic acid a,c-diamide synthase
MKSIILSSNSSGGGKTTIAVGLMRALMKSGFNVQGYKVGPDYIDPAFHSIITKKSSRNLDLFLMGENGVKTAYLNGNGDVGVIEGVMGLYDGKGVDSQYSTAHIAKVLELPVVLILSPKAQSATLGAELQGLLNYCDNYVENVNISGVILNNISPSYYELLKLVIESRTKLKVYGYIPNDKKLALESRNLGLVQAEEVEDIDEKIEICSNYILENVDMKMLLQDFREANIDCIDTVNKPALRKHNLKIAVAKDLAFNFYYKENLELLSSLGEVIYFSPLKDKSLPEDIDFLYIGGGYPEVFIKELSKNNSMLKSIRESLESGLPCYAECGGLMYLTEGIMPLNENSVYKTVGFFKGYSTLTKNLQNFGYAEILIEKENPLIEKGCRIKCHEFHRSKVTLEEEPIYKVSKKNYKNETKEWQCGYRKKNTLAGYGHIYFFNNVDFLMQLMNAANNIKLDRKNSLEKEL